MNTPQRRLLARSLMLSLTCQIISFSQGQTDQRHKLLPRAAESALSRLHPGWQLADISKENRDVCFRKNSVFEPTLIWGDFTGHRETDYAAIVRYSGKTGVVILVKQGEAYLPFDVFVSGKTGRRAPELLDVLPAGFKVPDEKIKTSHDSVVMQYCESSSVIVLWIGGSFRPIVIGD